MLYIDNVTAKVRVVLQDTDVSQCNVFVDLHDRYKS